jgi:cellulose synthase/poly-beta-1,6-N-acetylglucosamine synthase-like glycosyltransferase
MGITMLIIVLLPVYCILIQWIVWLNSKPGRLNPISQLRSLDILIIARNESCNLPLILSQISKEINEIERLIIVDDQSEDDTLGIAEAFCVQHPSKVKVVSTQAAPGISPKKAAILEGLRHSGSEWVWMCDADIRLQKGSISHKKNMISRADSEVVAGPVAEITDGSNFWELLSAVEQSMMNTLYEGSINLGAPMLCSGANLAFRRQWFQEASPFGGNLHIFSGDDLAILEASGNSVIFDSSKEAMAETRGPKSMRLFFMQRARRAGKLRYTGRSRTKFFGLMSLFSGIICLTAVPSYIIFGNTYERMVAGTSLLLYLVVMFKASRNGNLGRAPAGMVNTLIAGYLYPAFASLVPILVFSGKTSWKGRPTK